jgi:YD repeat-containing protein
VNSKIRRFRKFQILAHILWLVFPLYFYGRLLTSDAYRTSIEIAKSSSDLKRVLGEGVHAQWIPVGSALRSYNSDFAEWSVMLKGSTGSGHLYGVANHVGGVWEFSRITFVGDRDSGTVDLTPAPKRLILPYVDARKVYVVPLGLDSAQSLTWVPAYYRENLGLDVEVLSPVALGPSEIDTARKQYVAEKCIDLMTHSHPELASDPSAILIGVTSQDFYIGAFNWEYAENFREGGRMAVVSSARLRPTDYPGIWNKELLNSRLQKMITKNIVALYFSLPLSNDYTSILSAGVLSGKQIDYMSGNIVGAEGHWDSYFSAGEPMVNMTVAPGKKTSWVISYPGPSIPDRSMEYFTADLAIGLFIQRRLDFIFADEYPLEFARVYTSADDQSRAFGVGTDDSLDIFLTGQMGSFVDLSHEDGSRVHFAHVNANPGEPGDVYRASPGERFTQAVYAAGAWRVTSRNGWTYIFPYRPKARGAKVTVLTGFIDPNGHEYRMVRDDSGDLLSITTPSGKWLHFDHDAGHRIGRIIDSGGRSVKYDYNSAGQLVRVTDSEGHSESYSYNDRNEMISAFDTAGVPLITNQYTSSNLIASQTLGDGRHLEYGYNFASQRVIRQNFIKDPFGLMTYFDYDRGGYFQSFPAPAPQ